MEKIMTRIERPDGVPCFGFTPNGTVGDSQTSVWIDMAVREEMGNPRSPTNAVVQIAGSPLGYLAELNLSMGIKGAQISNTLAFVLGLEDGQPMPQLEILLVEK